MELFINHYMLNKIVKYTMMEYLPDEPKIEDEINPKRFFKYGQIKNQNGKTFYLITRNFREEDNFAMNYVKSNNGELIIFAPEFEVKNKNDFFQRNLNQFLQNTTLKYKIFSNKKDIENFINNENIKTLIKDFNPIENFNFKNTFETIEIDSHNICPVHYISDKQEYNAASYRRKVYHNIAEFFTEFPKTNFIKTESYQVLEDFLKNKINTFNQKRNDPTANVNSNLSPYLNLGFISSQRAALEVFKTNTANVNKEAFFEELIIRNELSDNFCFYNKNYKTLDGIPNWAKITLEEHSKDIRLQNYTIDQLENAKTNDELWNAAQKQLVKDGKIHGYMRMYWAKQILLWTTSPKKALEYAIYLNDKYAYDAPSASGYVGILWSIGGLHDRAFQERPISGKIRPMTYNGAKSKFDIKKYIQDYI